MKTISGKVILSIVTLLFSIMAAAIGMGLLGDSGLGFIKRFLCGFCFMCLPILIIAIIITMLRKNK